MEGLAEWKESLVDGKNPCIKCQSKGRDRSGDNFHHYGEGQGGYCHACEYTVPSDDVMDEIKSSKSSYSKTAKKEKATTRKDVNNENTFDLSDWKAMRKELSLDPSGYRGLNKDVCKKYDVLHEYSPVTGEIVKQVYPTTRDYKIVGCEFKVVDPKKFYKKGTSGNAVDLFGQAIHRNSNSKIIVITGGQLDALSADLMFSMHKRSGYEDIAVVSPTNGETSAYKQLQYHYEWLNRFEKIILCFDNDDAGREATEKAAKVLPRKKVYILDMTKNDPNEYLVEKESGSFWNAFWRVKKYIPSGILGSSGIRDKMIEYVQIPKMPLPPFMFKLQNLMAGGIPLGVIVVMASASGSGKTTIVDETSYFWYFNSPHKLGVLTLESDSAQYGINLLSRHVGNKINLIENEEDKLEYLNRPEIVEASNELFLDDEGNDRFFLVEERDGDLATIMSLTEELIISCGCKIIVFDPVSDVLEGLSNEDQATFYKWLKGITKEYTVTFILISHVRKSSGGSRANSTGADLHEEDFFGSSSIFKSSACNLIFTRNKEAEDEFDRNTTRMKATKIRWTGRTTPYAGEYYYENATHRMYDKEDYLKINPNKKVDSQLNKGDNGYTKVIKKPTKAPIKKAITNEKYN